MIPLFFSQLGRCSNLACLRHGVTRQDSDTARTQELGVGVEIQQSYGKPD